MSQREEKRRIYSEKRKKILLFIALSIIASRFAIIPSGQRNGEKKKKEERERERERERETK